MANQNMVKEVRLLSERDAIQEYVKTTSFPTFRIVSTSFEEWIVEIDGPLDSAFEGRAVLFSLTVPDNFPWSPPFITCLDTMKGTGFRKNKKLKFDGLSLEPWNDKMKILTIILSIQNMMATKKKRRKALAVALSSDHVEWCQEESDPDDDSEELPILKPIQEDIENQTPQNQSELLQEKEVSKEDITRANTSAETDSSSSDDNYRNLELVPLDIKEEPKDSELDKPEEIPKVAAPSRPRGRKRASTASKGPEKKKTQVQRASQRTTKNESSKAVDEIFKRAREAKNAYNESLKELDRALEEKLKTHENEAIEIQRKIQELVDRRRKLKESLGNL